MKSMFRRIAAIALPGFAVVLVVFAATAEAQGSASNDVHITAIGESVRGQLGDQPFQLAVARAGRLELTAEQGYANPSLAVGALPTPVSGDATSCHARFDGDLDVVLVVETPPAAAQPCGVLGIAYDAAS